MIVGIGTDLLDVARMECELSRDGAGFRDDVFTPDESGYCEGMRHPARHFAARFAAKEAFWKAVGDGPGPATLGDVEVERGEGGQPRLALRGDARAAAERLGVTRTFVSLAHTATLASATVILESDRESDRRWNG